MIPFEVVFLKEAKKDFDRLDGSVRPVVAKALRKVASNPLPESEGGYGKPLGKKSGSDLAGLLKIKLKGFGVRIVYKLQRREGNICIVVIGVRNDNEVYREAQRRRQKYGL